jgi:outer membrane murein-binding lipoprotein Lpp
MCYPDGKGGFMTDENRDTRPTIETVLDRINAVAEMFSGELRKLDAKIDSLRAEVDSLRAEVQALREESDKRLRAIIDRLDVIAIEMQEMRGVDRDFKRRISDLESKVS